MSFSSYSADMFSRRFLSFLASKSACSSGLFKSSFSSSMILFASLTLDSISFLVSFLICSLSLSLLSRSFLSSSCTFLSSFSASILWIFACSVNSSAVFRAFSADIKTLSNDFDSSLSMESASSTISFLSPSRLAICIALDVPVEPMISR